MTFHLKATIPNRIREPLVLRDIKLQFHLNILTGMNQTSRIMYAQHTNS